jgi:NADH-quinone oxidoreductase subunit N
VNQFAPLAPDLVLSAGGTLVLIVGALRNDRNMRDFLRWLSLVILALAGVALHATASTNPMAAAQGWIIPTPLNVMFGVAFLCMIAWTLLVSAVPDSDAGEWYSLMLFAGLGMLTLARSGNLAALFLGIELLSLSLYILIAFRYTRRASLRGATMYLVLAGFASGFLVFGLALVYAVFGSLETAAIRSASAGGMSPVALIGFGLFLVGVAFKLAAVPFHMWTPDVYEAAPPTITGIIASASKGAMLAAFLPFLFLLKTHWHILWILSVASMIVGNLLGLRENRVKRILAYSSIAHIGYVLVGYLGGGTMASEGVQWLPRIDAVSSVFFYVIAYSVTILGAFGVISLLECDEELSLRDLRGVAKKNPLLAACMLVFVISLAGIPPMVGFFGKIYLFSAAVNAGYVWLPILGLVGSAIGIFYYLRIIVNLYMLPSDASDVKVRATTLQENLITLSALTTLVLGLFPQLVFSLLN